MASARRCKIKVLNDKEAAIPNEMPQRGVKKELLAVSRETGRKEAIKDENAEDTSPDLFDASFDEIDELYRRKDVAQATFCAKLALEHFNKHKRDPQDEEYVLVEGVCSVGFNHVGFIWYHTNFTAKPKGAPDTEAKLFFVEMRSIPPANEEFDASNVRILKDRVGSNGCKACRRKYEGYSPTLHHPMDGFDLGCYVHRIDRKQLKNICPGSHGNRLEVQPNSQQQGVKKERLAVSGESGRKRARKDGSRIRACGGSMQRWF